MAVFNPDSDLLEYRDGEGQHRFEFVSGEPALLEVLDRIQQEGGRPLSRRTFREIPEPMRERMLDILNLLWTLDGVGNDPTGPWRTIGEDLMSFGASLSTSYTPK